ncbi:hypothetical protein VOLCADRAFT_93689 [Volvox carteri f. nagariensis]|uniref:Uncharacterized protein n=1 Tax=Volvox carteri f. nagariensis TaxID=3068 RepID=D8U2S7_VOLCA|nr:uncharacterized protein VOLCADRAFT_93689 [Volvox carteri f. nagariensis]EFJ45953.1 hypothetical protein VOLCADRAFT_93689 [Volvox carteri f. nagariensis]|eukprot:XP_002953031.1 hypothetical protein VOLCADRAFT_93689 [Volvox carteri f. nagariensis]
MSCGTLTVLAIESVFLLLLLLRLLLLLLLLWGLGGLRGGRGVGVVLVPVAEPTGAKRLVTDGLHETLGLQTGRSGQRAAVVSAASRPGKEAEKSGAEGTGATNAFRVLSHFNWQLLSACSDGASQTQPSYQGRSPLLLQLPTTGSSNHHHHHHRLTASTCICPARTTRGCRI